MGAEYGHSTHMDVYICYRSIFQYTIHRCDIKHAKATEYISAKSNPQFLQHVGITIHI